MREPNSGWEKWAQKAQDELVERMIRTGCCFKHDCGVSPGHTLDSQEVKFLIDEAHSRPSMLPVMASLKLEGKLP